MGWLKKLRDDLRAHKWSFLISLSLTLVGVGLYVYTYLAEGRSPLAQFAESIELKTFDTRFRIRSKYTRPQPSPDIVIVAIDQKTLDDLGAWPFSRVQYTRALDQLKRDGAAVVGFDITFPKPDEKSGLQELRQAKAEYLARTPPAERNPAFLTRLEEMERQADADTQFAEALRRAEKVVLGQFFFFNPAEVSHLDTKALEAYEEVLAFGAYTQVVPLPDKHGAPPPHLEEIYTGLEGYAPQPNLLEFADAANYSFGYFNFEADADGIFRHTNLVVKYKQDYFPSLDVQILRLYLGVPDQDYGLFYNATGVEHIQLGKLRIPTDPAGEMLINFQGPMKTYKHVSFSDVAAGRFPPGTFTKKIVLIGPTAIGIGDTRPIPLQEAGFPGVEIHANVLDTMLNQRFISRGLREELIDLGFIVLFGMGVGFVLARVRPPYLAPIAVTLLGIFLGVAYFFLVWNHMWLNIVVPAAVLIGNSATISAYRVLLEEREKRKVRGFFQQYVPPGVIKELEKDPTRLKLGGEERELTIMFTDIRGFTALSEKLTPLELTHFLNGYTDEMTDIIFHHWGTLDKFEGDAIMAFWGAPYEQEDHTLRACAAALDMGRRVDELRQQWRAEGKPDINIGLGMNTGRVVVGNMGSRKRFNYTVLGDPVNLASRLEGVNKEYSTRIILSETTYKQAADVLGLLERRITQEFHLRPGELVSPDGSPAARRARQVALFLGHAGQLAAPQVLAKHFGLSGEAVVHAAVAQVEHWQARDKKLGRFLRHATPSFRPFVFRQLDWIRVKGKQEPVAIYELLGVGGDENPLADLLAMFEGGLQAYRHQQWEFAIDLFETILEKYPNDGPARLFSKRCRQFIAEPPEASWDGVFVMKTK